MKTARTTSGKYLVEAVAKALDVLDAFSDTEELTLHEASLRVGLNKSRAFRLLWTLAEHGYVERSGDGSRYRLGVKLLERVVNVRRNIRDAARPFMLDLHRQFNEMVNFGVLDHRDLLYLEIVESSRPFRMSATVGCRMPAYLTSMGKAILAYLYADDPVSDNHSLLDDLSRPKLQALRRELQAVRRRGYAVDDQENERGVACIGAPVTDASGFPLAALSVSGPEHRVLDREKEIAAALHAACQGMARNLGLSAKAGRI